MEWSFPHRKTWVHRVNPGVKLIVSTLLFVAVVSIHNVNVMANVAAGVVLLLAVCSGHPWRRLLLYASPFLLIFVSSVSGMAMFGEGTTTWFRFGLVHVTEESFVRGVHLGLRSVSVAAAGLLFALTTKPADLFYGLMQQWKLPPKYAYSFLAALRMVPAIIEEFQIRRHALKIRGRLRRRGVAGWYDTLRQYAIPLLAQSIRRAHRIAVAMEAKRFHGNGPRTYYYRISYSAWDAAYVAAMAALIALAWYAGAAWPYVGSVDVR
ncbi:energy-coupling factor transporter transmembrane component T [Paenibacillus sp.]|uniref:energy-coupling factor transporter transmembrane component T family protein n=1 Tax=Paenibacillus sp. TaxID=58172 RepID=UPI002D722EBB|nr:energy-coupling factor transporter transmembrane component T [Paenibacillus sp.]HZG86563.1 energy-coupling factor transporter transmembrane component T [Paenibacillus sp.]